MHENHVFLCLILALVNKHVRAKIDGGVLMMQFLIVHNVFIRRRRQEETCKFYFFNSNTDQFYNVSIRFLIFFFFG